MRPSMSVPSALRRPVASIWIGAVGVSREHQHDVIGEVDHADRYLRVGPRR